MTGIVFFSSASENTARFVARLGLPAQRLPVRPSDPMPAVAGPFVLVCPTYADGAGRGAVPKSVIAFLNDPRRRALLRGVIGGGNRSFGATFALAARVVAQKCSVPVLWRFELAGTDNDIRQVHAGLQHVRRTECLTV